MAAIFEEGQVFNSRLRGRGCSIGECSFIVTSSLCREHGKTAFSNTDKDIILRI